MRRGALKRTTELARGEKPLERRTPLAAVSPRKADQDKPRRRSTLRAGGFTPASPAQRAKVKQQGCRITAQHGPHVHPAHVTPRSLDGCDHEDCVVGLRADLHRLYDERQDIGLLERLTYDEQAHAAAHLGLLGALKRVTNSDWAPVEQ